MCNYIFQNIIISFLILIYYLFVIKKGPTLSYLLNKDRRKNSEPLLNWIDLQGWFGLVVFIVLNLIGYFGKWLNLSIILSVVGIDTCGCGG